MTVKLSSSQVRKRRNERLLEDVLMDVTLFKGRTNSDSEARDFLSFPYFIILYMTASDEVQGNGKEPIPHENCSSAGPARLLLQR